MNRSELNDMYFEWMYHIVCDDNRYTKRFSYRRLLHCLHDIPFTFIIPMDGNRAEDGIDLRYRFGYENQIDGSAIATFLDDKKCSVLEMMIALAIRCEEHIMDDPDIGNRTGQWFWNMIINLGLGQMSDGRFNDRKAREIVDIFLNREYEQNGSGGLFTLKHSHRDMRNVEIWYQMNWYLNEIA